jgi:hypothetical protein
MTGGPGRGLGRDAPSGVGAGRRTRREKSPGNGGRGRGAGANPEVAAGSGAVRISTGPPCGRVLPETGSWMPGCVPSRHPGRPFRRTEREPVQVQWQWSVDSDEFDGHTRTHARFIRFCFGKRSMSA